MSKVVKSLKEAIILSGLQNGMTISFHHHLRYGDTIANDILREISAMGYKDIKVAASSILDATTALVDVILDKTVTSLDATGVSKAVGEILAKGALAKPVTMRTHGGRPQAIENGSLKIDVAFIAASCSDSNGNCSGYFGRSAFGSIGYSYADARYADKVIVITDNLVEDPLVPMSIDQSQVDYVVVVDSIGDPGGIQAKSTRITKDPVNLKIAADTAKVIEYSGLLRDGFCFQSGAGGISLAVTRYIHQIMKKKGIAGRYGLGGITGAFVEMLEEGLFKALYDVQCFDTMAVQSLSKNTNHLEVSASLYANPDNKGCLVNGLDCVVLGATEIDLDFNVNVHTDSNNVLMGGAGGHGDTAQGAKMAIITAPAFRARIPIIVDRVNTISTPGSCIDVFVSQFGVAVNTKNKGNEELAYRLKNAGINVMDMHDLKAMTEKITGTPNKAKKGKKTIAQVIWRDGTVLDEIKGLE